MDAFQANPMTAGRVAIAMSGGVDSSTAAVILKQAGLDLVGFSMQLWDQRRKGSGETAPALRGAARSRISTTPGKSQPVCRFLITWSIFRRNSGRWS